MALGDNPNDTLYVSLALYRHQLDAIEDRVVMQKCSTGQYIVRAISVYNRLVDDGRITFDGDPDDGNVIIKTGPEPTDG